jgi:hypothetical protein
MDSIASQGQKQDESKIKTRQTKATPRQDKDQKQRNTRQYTRQNSTQRNTAQDSGLRHLHPMNESSLMKGHLQWIGDYHSHLGRLLVRILPFVFV